MRAGLVAGAWLAPVGVLWFGLALLRLLGGGGTELLAVAVGVSLLAGAPAAAVAAASGAATLPAGLAGLAALAVGAGAGFAVLGLPARGVVELALAGAGLAALWAALGPGVAGVRAVGTGLLLALPLAVALGGDRGVLAGLALGAGAAAVIAAAPLAMSEPRLRRAAWPAALGFAAALAVLAAPVSAWLRGDGAAIPVLASLVAVPGLCVVATTRAGGGLALGTALLGLGALVAGLALVVGSAPAAAGLIPAEAVIPFRHALLGAAFLPVLAALVAALLERGAALHAMLPLLLLAVVGAALPFALDGTAAEGLDGLLGPVLATGLAAMLLGRK
jgi:hypothetical protein